MAGIAIEETIVDVYSPRQPMRIDDCTLESRELHQQAARYRRLGAAAIQVERDDHWLLITFGPGLDQELLDEALAVERRCCAFLDLGYEPSERRLSIWAEKPRGVEALDAIRSAITGINPA